MTELARTGSAPALAIDGRIAVVRLCRPEQANRLETGDLQVLLQYFRQLAEQHAQVRALVVTGTGRHFSAGFDLRSVDSAVLAESNQTFAAMVDALEALPQITVCAINGGVFGGATDLALACDFRIGIPETRMFMPAARFGLHYYESGLRRYLTRLGLDNAKKLFLLAQEHDAQALLGMGYLTSIAASEGLYDEAMAHARRAAELAPLATAGMKRALNAMARGSYDPEEGSRLYRACMTSADLQEGLAAVREKRDPRFEGR